MEVACRLRAGVQSLLGIDHNWLRQPVSETRLGRNLHGFSHEDASHRSGRATRGGSNTGSESAARQSSDNRAGSSADHGSRRGSLGLRATLRIHFAGFYRDSSPIDGHRYQGNR
jgi:hypothetical protein